jgi:DNA repair exonuclease SbcCD ATPase subunit
MTYLLFFLSIGLATALALVSKKLQQQNKDRKVDRQRLEESDRKYGELISRKEKLDIQIISLKEQITQLNQQAQSDERDRKVDRQRLEDSDRKYGGLISREDTTRQLDIQIISLKEQITQLNQQAQSDEQELSTKILLLRKRLQGLEEQEFFESFGFYDSKYNFQESVIYKQRLDQTRAQQKQIIKDKKAAVCLTEWSVGGSVKEGKKMTDNFIKLVLRAFNGECDASVMKVKYNNVQTMENRVRKTYEDLNKLSQTTHCDITSSYLNLKLQELWLTHEYQEKKYQEQEEQRIIREQMREEEKALRELEKIQQDAEREERRYEDALAKARLEVESATGKAQEKLFSQIEELQKRLTEAEVNKERAISQAQLTKSGHVYIISNIGSFGEDVYKIGMTRRLEPTDRVKELSSASVPFPFDVHAMIFCNNAPELESRLHKRLEDSRINKENLRKEFFRVSIDEIVRVVRETDAELKIGSSEITFTKIAEAADYRKTLARERNDKVVTS